MTRQAVRVGAVGAAQCVASAGAGAPLFSNGSSDPSALALAPSEVALNGAPAPDGFFWSETATASGEANAAAGFSGHDAGPGASGAFRFADDFVITHRYGWRIDVATFALYQAGYEGVAPPVGAINVRIWDGPPTNPASTVVWGDTSSNVLLDASVTNIYRVFSSIVAPQPAPPDTTRRIWSARANLGGVTLPPGEYWLDWQCVPEDPDQALYIPAATTAGARSTPNANALLFRPSGSGAWAPIVDLGKPASAADIAQDAPFLLEGDALPAPCPGDANGDNLVNFADLNIVLGEFGQVGTLLPGDLNSDGVVNFADLNIVLSAFGTAC